MPITYSRKYAFTLIELLIVIVIIGILAGVVLAVINPTVIIRRSQEGVLRSTVAKMCQGLFACAVSSSRVSECDSWNEIGVTLPADPGVQRHAMRPYSTTLVVVEGGIPRGNGSTNNCIIYCAYNFTTGQSLPPTLHTGSTTMSSPSVLGYSATVWLVSTASTTANGGEFLYGGQGFTTSSQCLIN